MGFASQSGDTAEQNVSVMPSHERTLSGARLDSRPGRASIFAMGLEAHRPGHYFVEVERRQRNH